MYAKIFILVYNQVPEKRSVKFRFLILVPKMQQTVIITSSFLLHEATESCFQRQWLPSSAWFGDWQLAREMAPSPPFTELRVTAYVLLHK